MTTPEDHAAARAAVRARLAAPDTRTDAEREADSAWDRNFCNAALAALAPALRRMDEEEPRKREEEPEMSYCRLCEDSDVYLYRTASGLVCCCLCTFAPATNNDVFFDTPADALAHARAHLAAGDRVPERAIERLRKEAAPAPKTP